jgi:selenocysteine lyase/cysteine desulfurase
MTVQNVADLIGADTKDVVFTSGATESNNMIIKGVARFHKEKKRHVVTTQTVCFDRTPALPLLRLCRSTNVSWIHAATYKKRDLRLPIFLSNKMASSI